MLIKWATCFLFMNFISGSSQSLSLDHNPTTYGIKNEEAILKCSILSDMELKQIVWYRKKAVKRTVYYYEPSSKINRALDPRMTLSPLDNSSLSISPAILVDQGTYICHVEVWDRATVTNSTLDKLASIPVEEEATMELVINVPPSKNVQLREFMNESNMTLTCKTTGAKPAAAITWLKTTPDGKETELRSREEKTIIEKHGSLSDTTAHLYYPLSPREEATTISCVVRHPETKTTLFKNVTIVSPAIQNGVEVYMDRLGGSVQIGSVTSQDSEDREDVNGLVQVSVDPGLKVAVNSSITLRASAPDVFPPANFNWWTGEEVTFSGPVLYIPRLEENAKYFVMARNPAGRVVLTIPLSVDSEEAQDEMNSNSTALNHEVDEIPGETEGLNGGLIAAIVIGTLLALLLIGLTVWYCTCKNPPNEDVPDGAKKRKIVKHETDAVPYVESGKPLMRTTSTQTLEGRRSKKDAAPIPAKSEDNILSSSSRRSARGRTPPPQYASKERPMQRHLKDYDESASFVGDYGSRDGLETASDEENLQSVHEEDEDSRSEKTIPASEDSLGGRFVQEDVV